MAHLVYEADKGGVEDVSGRLPARLAPGGSGWWEALFAARRLLQRAVAARADMEGLDCWYVEGEGNVALVVSGPVAQLVPVLWAVQHEPLVFGARLYCADEGEREEVSVYVPAGDREARETFEEVCVAPPPRRLERGEDPAVYEARTMHALVRMREVD